MAKKSIDEVLIDSTVEAPTKHFIMATREIRHKIPKNATAFQIAQHARAIKKMDETEGSKAINKGYVDSTDAVIKRYDAETETVTKD